MANMDKDRARRIQSAAARNPNSPTARSGFDRRAQAAGDKDEHRHRDDEDER